jgi:hypothetical protein
VRVGVSGAEAVLFIMPQPDSRAMARMEVLSSFMEGSPSVKKLV